MFRSCCSSSVCPAESAVNNNFILAKLVCLCEKQTSESTLRPHVGICDSDIEYRSDSGRHQLAWKQTADILNTAGLQYRSWPAGGTEVCRQWGRFMQLLKVIFITFIISFIVFLIWKWTELQTKIFDVHTLCFWRFVDDFTSWTITASLPSVEATIASVNANVCELKHMTGLNGFSWAGLARPSGSVSATLLHPETGTSFALTLQQNQHTLWSQLQLILKSSVSGRTRPWGQRSLYSFIDWNVKRWGS